MDIFAILIASFAIHFFAAVAIIAANAKRWLLCLLASLASLVGVYWAMFHLFPAFA